MTTTTYNILLMLTATPDWLRLSRDERNAFMDAEIVPILAKYAEKVGVRWLDCEAFSARCSDLAIFEAADLRDYYFLMEELRDTRLFAQPYFKLEEIITGIEDGFRQFEGRED